MFRTPPTQLPDGQIIFAEGAPSSHAYLVESGEVEVFVVREVDGRRIRLATLGAGELVGEMSLVDERPRSATACAVGPTTIQPFTRDEFEELILKRPDASLRLIRALFERLRLMNARVERLETDPGLPGEDGVGPASADGSVDAPPSPAATLYGLTDRARAALPADGLALRTFPWRVGRDEGGALDLNELHLKDDKPYQVSRNHLCVERDGSRLLVRDRGSYLGTLVNGERLGGKRRAGATHLVSGDNEIMLGRHKSPWRFRLTVRADDA